MAEPAIALEKGAFSHPLIRRLTIELNWPRLTSVCELTSFTQRPGVHCAFVPGNPERNLETADAAIILPELCSFFQGAFDCALVDDAIEAQLRKEFNALATPGFLFFRAGTYLGSIQRIQDWQEYQRQIRGLLELPILEQRE